MTPYFNIMFAMGPAGEFSYNKKMPWPRIKEDLNFFKKVTTNTQGCTTKLNAVIMGRNTFESLSSTPLTGRVNIVVSKKLSDLSNEFGFDTPYIPATSLGDALTKAGELMEQGKVHRIFLIGGVKLIYEGLRHPLLEYVYETTVYPRTETAQFQADNYIFPDDSMASSTSTELINIKETALDTEDGKYNLKFIKYMVRRDHPENEYLDVCEDIIARGSRSSNRTGIDTLSTWGVHLTFDMDNDGFPLYTTKEVMWNGIVEELLFFLSGKTDSKLLEAKGVHIWKGNTTREFLDKVGKPDYNVGEMGPMYGWQWRHYGAEYVPNVQLDIGQGGLDQIQWLIDSIKTVKRDPSNSLARRLLVTTWNPVDLPKMAINPCHYCFQFSVSGDRLNCLVNMRSNDMGCGNPFNVASYALLTHMICHLTDLKPGKLVMSLADCHIYTTHIDAFKKQLSRPPRKWPTLTIPKLHQSINDFTLASFNLTGYQPHPKLPMKMAV
jgi:dihydrofolate reductase/thymidylate synthase